MEADIPSESMQAASRPTSHWCMQLHHVRSDLGGKTGMAIVDAILAGERDTQTLAKLRAPRRQ